jgi:hypothetical protein
MININKKIFAIEVIVDGIELDDNDEHSSKQQLLIEVIVFGIEMDDNSEHSR